MMMMMTLAVSEAGGGSNQHKLQCPHPPQTPIPLCLPPGVEGPSA
jgi:hypothetical protein